MPIVLPTRAPQMLTGADAIAIAKRARTLLRAGRITHRQLALLDCMLWSCRSAITGAITVSYTALQRLAHTSRQTIATGLRVLERLGLLSRIKRRVRVTWHQGGSATRQATSGYVLHPPAAPGHTESPGRTVIQTIEIHKEADSVEMQRAQAALADRRRVVEERLTRGAGKIESSGAQFS